MKRQRSTLIINCFRQYNIGMILMFYVRAGDYAGFDEKEPTSKNGGKAEVICMLKEKYNYTKLFMIGDGITDLEACPPADAFIGKSLYTIF